MTDKTNDIIQVINSYTDQIERYENLSTWFAAFCVACILAVIAIAVFLIIKREEEAEHCRAIYNSVLSGIFLIIPSVTTLYLYVFSMNMRKVALYRGYLGFLERQWNSLAGVDIMLFDEGIMGRFFSLQNFLVNGLGPVVMAVFIVLSMIVGFGLSIYFWRKIRDSGMKKILKLLLCVLLLVCVLFDGLCTYYLSTNGNVTEAVMDYCEK